MKIYVTKYALTKGILEGEGYCEGHRAMVTFENDMGRFTRAFNGLEWWVTKAEAISHAKEMQNQAIKDIDDSLRKRRERLSTLVFD